jgi:hypothetical protein
MLDLNHPQTKFTFAIAGEDGIVLSVAKRMTLVDTAAKSLLLPRAHEATKKMREICIEGWGNKQKKLDAIELVHNQITEFAAVHSTNDFVTDWQGKLCTVCESEITNLEKYDDMLYCPKCLDCIAEGRRAVDHAFGLWAI